MNVTTSAPPVRRFAVPLRAQTVLLSVVPLFFLVVLFVIATILQHEAEQTTSLTQRSTNALAQSELLSKTISDANRSMDDYVRNRHPADKAAYEAAMNSLPQRERTLRDIVRDEHGQPARAVALSTATTRLVTLLNEYFGDLVAGRKTQAQAFAGTAHTRAVVNGWSEAKSKFDQAERIATIERFNALHEKTQALGRAFIVCSIAGIVLTLLLATRFGLRLAQRLRRLAENARALGAGEAAPPIAGNDEIADLDAVYREMMQRIRESVREKEAALAAYEREHAVASTLQHALLPQELPEVPGLRIDTAYVPAAVGTEIGGDWYDVFPMSGRCFGISVGDVAGHGLRAATAMGTVRQAIRFAARDESSPAAVLRRVNRMLCADDRASLVTAFVAVLDLEDGSLRYVAAGHPQPIVIRPGAVVELLRSDGLMLGVDPRARYEDAYATLDLGSGLVLYTDGLVEIEHDYLQGMLNLEEAVRDEYREPSANIAEGIQRRIFARAEPRDDSAILFVGVTALGQRPSPLRQTWSLDARDAASAHRVKRALLWHAGGFAGDADLAPLETVFGELLSNVARHTPGQADVELECRDRSVVLHVGDRGPAFTANGNHDADLFAENGRGMLLMNAMATDVTITRTDGGNRVTAVLPLATD